MSRACGVCEHPLRQSIDRDLLAHAETYRGMARRYGLEADALRRHEHQHLHTSLKQIREAKGMRSVENLADEMEQYQAAVCRTLAQAEADADGRLTLMSVRESRGGVSGVQLE